MSVGFTVYDPFIASTLMSDQAVLTAINCAGTSGLNWVRTDDREGLVELGVLGWMLYSVLHVLGLTKRVDQTTLEYQLFRIVNCAVQRNLFSTSQAQWNLQILTTISPQARLPEFTLGLRNIQQTVNFQAALFNCRNRLHQEQRLTLPFYERMFSSPQVSTLPPVMQYVDDPSQDAKAIQFPWSRPPVETPRVHSERQPVDEPPLVYGDGGVSLDDPLAGQYAKRTQRGYSVPSFQDQGYHDRGHSTKGYRNQVSASRVSFSSRSPVYGASSRNSGDRTQEFLEFYRGGVENNRGVTIENIWARSGQELEDDHYFIQWLFIGGRPSGANPTACTWNQEILISFYQDPDLKDRYIHSFGMMLCFYGFNLDKSTGQITDRQEPKTWYIGAERHNFARQTRIMSFLKAVGRVDLAQNFYRALLPYAEPPLGGTTGGIPVDTINRHWKPIVGL